MGNIGRTEDRGACQAAPFGRYLLGTQFMPGLYWALQCREIRAGFAMEEIMLRRIHTVQYTVSSAIVAGSLRRDSGEVRRLEAKPSIEEEVVGWSH